MSRDFEQIFGQIVSVRIKTLGNINTVASRLIKRGKGSLPVDVRRSKTSLLKLPNKAQAPKHGEMGERGGTKRERGISSTLNITSNTV